MPCLSFVLRTCFRFHGPQSLRDGFGLSSRYSVIANFLRAILAARLKVAARLLVWRCAPALRQPDESVSRFGWSLPVPRLTSRFSKTNSHEQKSKMSFKRPGNTRLASARSASLAGFVGILCVILGVLFLRSFAPAWVLF